MASCQLVYSLSLMRCNMTTVWATDWVRLVCYNPPLSTEARKTNGMVTNAAKRENVAAPDAPAAVVPAPVRTPRALNRGYLYFEERHMGANAEASGRTPRNAARGGRTLAASDEDYGQAFQRALRAGLDAGGGSADKNNAGNP